MAVDISLDFPMRGLWDACRHAAVMAADAIRVRQALTPLVIGFNESARWLDVSDLADLEWNAVYRINAQHALSLARYALAHAAKRILFIADSEPTSYCDAHSKSYLDYPSAPETERITLNEARACAIEGSELIFYS
jgi:uncharacterized protein with von Willebrand factor type A (vWA) domain